MKRLTIWSWLTIALCAASTGYAVGCNHAPPTLSPVAQTAFTNTRVIKALDLLRDTAISANAQTPPVLSTATTRKIVTAHEATLKIINAAGSGWQSAVTQALNELVKDKALLPAELAVITPYVSMIQTLIAGIR